MPEKLLEQNKIAIFNFAYFITYHEENVKNNKYKMSGIKYLILSTCCEEFIF